MSIRKVNGVTVDADTVDSTDLAALIAQRTVATGSYVGNETARDISVGFKCSMVIVQSIASGTGGDVKASFFAIPSLSLEQESSYTIDVTAYLSLHASDGFTLSTSKVTNKTGSTYYYWAISE